MSGAHDLWDFDVFAITLRKLHNLVERPRLRDFLSIPTTRLVSSRCHLIKTPSLDYEFYGFSGACVMLAENEMF